MNDIDALLVAIEAEVAAVYDHVTGGRISKGVSDPEEVCPEFTHTGYCPDRLCERGCKHEPGWKVGDRVEHTIHGIGEVIAYATHTTYRPYQVRFSGGDAYWFEAGDIQEAPPVSDTVIVELPRWVAAGYAGTNAPSGEEYGHVVAACRSALTAEKKEGN